MLRNDHRESTLYQVIFHHVKYIGLLVSREPDLNFEAKKDSSSSMHKWLLKNNVLSIFSPNDDLHGSLTIGVVDECAKNLGYSRGNHILHSLWHSHKDELNFKHTHSMHPEYSPFTPDELNCMLKQFQKMQPSKCNIGDDLNCIINKEDALVLKGLIKDYKKKYPAISGRNNLISDEIYFTINLARKSFVTSFINTLLTNYLQHYLAYKNIDTRIKVIMLEGLKTLVTYCMTSFDQAAIQAAARIVLEYSLSLLNLSETNKNRIINHAGSILAITQSPISFFTSCIVSTGATELGQFAAYQVIWMLPKIPKLKMDENQARIDTKPVKEMPASLIRRFN